MQLMGEKTGSFTATLSSDPAALEPASLAQFDAVYLNNTVGDIFATPEVRAAFAAFVANGGGLVGNHGASVASTAWTEFGEILGARGASHREPDEKALINVEDPTHPITRAFDGKPFEFTDEFYRLAAPYSRDKVRVLLSLDPIATDMMQGRCFGQCLRDDNDYPVAWIRQHGKGRVFYTSVGHSPPVFWDPRMLEMFLAGVQYALGDLQADATPRPRKTDRFDDALTGMAQYDWGQDRGPVRRFERELVLVAATKEGAAGAEGKMLKILQSNVPLGAKDVICRQLAIFGSSRSEPVLQQMLRNKNTRSDGALCPAWPAGRNDLRWHRKVASGFSRTKAVRDPVRSRKRATRTQRSRQLASWCAASAPKAERGTMGTQAWSCRGRPTKVPSSSRSAGSRPEPLRRRKNVRRFIARQCARSSDAGPCRRRSESCERPGVDRPDWWLGDRRQQRRHSRRRGHGAQHRDGRDA